MYFINFHDFKFYYLPIFCPSMKRTAKTGHPQNNQLSHLSEKYINKNEYCFSQDFLWFCMYRSEKAGCCHLICSEHSECTVKRITKSFSYNQNIRTALFTFFESVDNIDYFKNAYHHARASWYLIYTQHCHSYFFVSRYIQHVLSDPASHPTFYCYFI